MDNVGISRRNDRADKDKSGIVSLISLGLDPWILVTQGNVEHICESIKTVYEHIYTMDIHYMGKRDTYMEKWDIMPQSVPPMPTIPANTRR